MEANQLFMPMTLENVNESADHWCRTQSNIQKVIFKWTIDDFITSYKSDVGHVFQSPPFPTEPNNEIVWRLKLYQKAKIGEELTGYFSIMLCLLGKPANKPNVLAKLRITYLSTIPEKSMVSLMTDAHHFELNAIWGLKNFMPIQVLMNPDNGMLPDDKLTILCEVICVTDMVNLYYQRLGQFEVPKCEIADDFHKIISKKKFSDVKLVLDKREIPAHRAILAARSCVFAAMFDQETLGNKMPTVTITDLTYNVLQEMLVYIYTGCVPKLKEMSAHLLDAACKYKLSKLKIMCEESLFANITVERAAETLILADHHEALQLKKNTMTFIAIHGEEVIKTVGWAALRNHKSESGLVADVFEALYKPPL